MMSSPSRNQDSGKSRPLDDLLQHLDVARPQTAEAWRGWHVTPVTGGANNLLYRATGEDGDYVVKFTVRDDRDRAGREYAALTALRQAGLSLAPKPIWLEREGVPGARWDQLTVDYAQRSGDPTAALRIQTYTAIMLVWWVVRWARFLYEAPRGLDARLVSRPANWLIEVERQYKRYLAWAQAGAGAPDWCST